MPAATVADTLVVPFNDLDALEHALREHRATGRRGDRGAGSGNMGVVPPVPGSRGAAPRDDRHGTVLIFDEVMTGCAGAAAGRRSSTGSGDLTCLGKVLGGGLPAAAYGGRRDHGTVAPVGPVYQAGTLSGNPIAMAAGARTR